MESDTKGHSRELPNMGLNEEGDKRVDTLFSFNSNANTPTMSSIVDYLKVWQSSLKRTSEKALSQTCY